MVLPCDLRVKSHQGVAGRGHVANGECGISALRKYSSCSREMGAGRRLASKLRSDHADSRNHVIKRDNYSRFDVKPVRVLCLFQPRIVIERKRTHYVVEAEILGGTD